MTPIEAFKDEIDLITDEGISKFVVEVFQKLTPGYFMKVPCSTSGKYHPKISLGDGGLVRHIKYAIYWVLELMNCWPNLDETAIDEAIAALLLHDLKKNGEKLDARGFPTLQDATAVHGPYLEKQIRETFPDAVKDERINRIVCAIAAHMGIWTSKIYENKKPQHQTGDSKLYDLCTLVHLADYCSSRKADEEMESIMEQWPV